MTTREAVILMRDGLIAQGQQAMGEFRCAFLTFDGCRCAIGQLFKFYRPEYELMDVRELTERGIIPEGLDNRVLVRCQSVHDLWLPEDGLFPDHIKHEFDLVLERLT